MVFLTTNVINGLVLVVLFVLYFFLKSRVLHIGVALGILLQLFRMDVQPLLIVLVGVFLVGVSYTFLFQRSAGRSHLLAFFGVFLLATSLTAPQVVAEHSPDHTPAPPGYEEAPDIVLEILEFHSVGRVTDQPSMHLLGTDYLTFDNGKLQAYLTQGPNPIEDAACFTSVLYPNNTVFIDNMAMFAINRTYFEGMYFLDFTVPNVTGVYPVVAHCFYNVSSTKNIVDTRSGNNTKSAGNLFSLTANDGDLFEITGTNVCNNADCNQFFNITLPTGWNTIFLTDLRLYFTVATNALTPGNPFNFSVFNHNTSQWDSLLMFAKNLNEGQHQFSLNETQVSPNNIVNVRIQSFDFKSNVLQIDTLHTRLFYNGTIVENLRGNEELVISKKLNNATNLIIAPPEEELLSGDTVINILILVGILISAVAGAHLITALLLLLWTILYSQGNIYIIITFLLVSVSLFYQAFRKN